MQQQCPLPLLGIKIGVPQLPLIIGDGPGFLVNRLLLTYLNVALELVTAGVALQQIDAAMVEFGMPLGPLELLDEIGLDTVVQSGIVLAEIFGERSAGSELLVRLVKARQLGKKVGAGFYQYPERTPNPPCGEIIQRLFADRSDRFDQLLADPAEIARRLLRPMVAEAARVLVEKKVASAWQVDLATVFGLGFPLWRGGLLWWAEQSGLKIPC